jgi:hypothetical protein
MDTLSKKMLEWSFEMIQPGLKFEGFKRGKFYCYHFQKFLLNLPYLSYQHLVVLENTKMSDKIK